MFFQPASLIEYAAFDQARTWVNGDQLLQHRLSRWLLFLDGVYVDNWQGTWFRWVKAATSAELTQLSQTIARRVGRFLERQGLLERDAEKSYLSGDALEAGPMDQLRGHSITYRIAIGIHQGRKVFTLQTVPASDLNEQFGNAAGNVAGFSLHAGVAAKAHQRDFEQDVLRFMEVKILPFSNNSGRMICA